MANQKTFRMNRTLFLQRMAGIGCCAAFVSASVTETAAETTVPSGGAAPLPPASALLSDELALARQERDFVQNWLTDLFNTMENLLDEATRIRLLEGCGRGCYNRHAFKKEISEAGKGNLEKLMEAYRRNFEIWQEADEVHIRFGKKPPGCYCPVMRNQNYPSYGLHCNCTKATHQAIFEQALGRSFPVKILETVRRGGQTCHFVVDIKYSASGNG